ncbi:hypothetical protein K2P47_05060 [Patescibacteria group bacterium]|nr:hypothetical protein [Patescibacteria group bacterium]
MKKTYIIIGGGTAVLLLLAIWAYLLIYGTPKPVENFFTDFSFSGGTTDESIVPFIPVIPDSQVDVASTPLRQLTVKPVIGFKEVPSTTGGESVMLYAEAGTGHVFSINLVTGMEVRLSNITIPNAQQASFNTDGTMAAIRSGYGSQNTIELLKLLGENNSTQETLVPKMVDFEFNSGNRVLYTEYSSSGMLGREYDTETGTSRTLFTVPFQNVSVAWSTNTSTPYYVYPKPSARLTGFLYRIVNGVIVREQASGEGLTALANDTFYIHTVTTSQGPISYATNRVTGQIKKLFILAQPDKCVFSSTDDAVVYCGFENKNLTYEFPDNWYKGLVSFSDTLWKFDVTKGEATKLIDTLKETGRELDVIGMEIGTENKVLYFINKNDNTLWMYEI